MLWALGWIIAAFLAGCLLMRPRFISFQTASMRDRFAQLGSLSGLSYTCILRRIGSRPQRACHGGPGRILRRWEDNDYFITLAFDRRGRCLGVEEERFLCEGGSIHADHH